ncbi:hypothetical protein ACFUKV_37735 [Streptomyces paradoxus]|uniref:hypothetical protein n=1 Tax=Streptomyces paradoxus TaxID=66375 RepID=UPI0036423275
MHGLDRTGTGARTAIRTACCPETNGMVRTRSSGGPGEVFDPEHRGVQVETGEAREADVSRPVH